MEKFLIGALLGGVAGALLTANNYKMRTLVKKSQEEAQAKFDKFMDDRIEDLEDRLQNIVRQIDDIENK